MNLERYFLIDNLNQNLVKRKPTTEAIEFSEGSQGTKLCNKKSRIEKVLHKCLSQLQLELELTKFEVDVDDKEAVDQETLEAGFVAQLQHLIIVPYAERLQNLLTDLFT